MAAVIVNERMPAILTGRSGDPGAVAPAEGRDIVPGQEVFEALALSGLVRVCRGIERLVALVGTTTPPVDGSPMP